MQVSTWKHELKEHEVEVIDALRSVDWPLLYLSLY